MKKHRTLYEDVGRGGCLLLLGTLDGRLLIGDVRKAGVMRELETRLLMEHYTEVIKNTLVEQ
jgi:hypothetical protein